MHTVPLTDGYEVSDDPARLDMPYILTTLAAQYWTAGRDPAITVRSWANSLGIGVYGPDGRQMGFARLLTDYATRAHLNDVFIEPALRGKGLGQGLVAAILAHSDLETVRHWSLTTMDAHGLYARFGFQAGVADERFMVMTRSSNPLP